MVKQISWKDFKIKDAKANLIPNGWDSFEPYGNEGKETRAPLEVFEEGYNRNYLLNSDVRVDFEEQDVIPTTVEEYLPTEVGRNLIGTFNMTPGLWIRAQGDGQLGTLVRIGSDFIEISGGEYYTLKYDGTSYDGSTLNKVVAFYDDLSIFIERKTFTDTDEVSIFKTPLNARYLRLAYATSPVTNPQAIYDNFAKLEKGNTPTDWSPAPEDFNNLKGKSYALSQPLRKENTLSLNGSFEEDDFIGLWLGNDKFVGFLDNQELAFNLTENYDDEFVVVKTLSEKGIIDNAKLEKGSTPTVWTPAWEDIPEEEKPARAWNNMAVHMTPLGNGLTRIQTWGGKDRLKLIIRGNPSGTHTTSFYLKTKNYLMYMGSDDTYKSFYDYDGYFNLTSDYKISVIGRIFADKTSDNLDFIASDPIINEGEKPNPTMIVTELDDGREHVQVYGADGDTELVYKGGGAIIGEPYVIESEIENLGGQLQMETTLDSAGQVIDKGINQVSIKGTTDSKEFEIGVKLRDGTI